MNRDWAPGKRIQRIPRVLHIPAILFRNLYFGTRWHWNRRLGFRTWYPNREILKKLYFGVDYVWSELVEGDIAEFGTMSGATAAVLARALSETVRLNPRATRPKKLLLFDSFAGLPDSQSDVDRESLMVATGVWSAGTCKGISKEKLVKKCSRFLDRADILVYDGWFKETLSILPADTKLGLLHIDCDLYESTMDVLGFVFSNGMVSEGAAIFFDDWSCNRASPEFGERRAWAEILEKHSVNYTDCGEYGTTGWKIIVHSYDARKSVNQAAAVCGAPVK